MTSKTVTQDVPSPGTTSDLSSSVLMSRPGNQDIPCSDPTKDSILTSPFTFTCSSHVTNMPVSKEVPELSTSNDWSSLSVRSHHQDPQQNGDKSLGEIVEFRDRPESPLDPHQRAPKSPTCPALVLEGVTSSVTQGEALQLHSAEFEELAGPQRSCSAVQIEVTFDDIAVYFSKEEWAVLEPPQKDLYRQVMMDNYHFLSSLGFLLDKPGLILRIEDGEAELWEERGALGRFSLCGGNPSPGTAGLQSRDKETSENVGRDPNKSSSHLGALMRLVNEIPGFLLGGSSPGHNLEDAENIQLYSEGFPVKMEESSPSCTPAWVYNPQIRETPESSSPGTPWTIEKSNPASTKSEEVEVPLHPPYRQSQLVRHSHLQPLQIKSEPDTCTATSSSRELRIKQEELPMACSPASNGSSMKIKAPLRYKHPVPGSWESHPADNGRHSGGGRNPWTSLPPSAGDFPCNSSVLSSPLSDGPSGAALKDLHIKIKQEDSGSERDPTESPVCGRKVPSSPMAPSSSILEHLRLRVSPRRSTMARKSPHCQEVPHGISHLHGLVNCLKEISANHLWTQPSAPPTGRRGVETDKSSADSPRAVKRPALDSSSPSCVLSVLWRSPDEVLKEEPSPAASGSPNPFTVAVTNGSEQLRGPETKMVESFRSRLAEPPAEVTPSSGKCPDRVNIRPSGGHNAGNFGFQKTEEPRRTELGVKRTHSDDLSALSSGSGSAKRPTLDSSSPSRVVGTLWIPPDDGKCPLMSVRNCVRKIPSCWALPPPVRGAVSAVPEPCHTRTGTHAFPLCKGGGIPGRMIEVKEEKSPSPIPTPTRQCVPPSESPGSPNQSGGSTNIHLSGLMKLMEEIPVAESSSSSRAMYNIAIGHSMMRRPERTNFLSYYNDDGSFQAELNDSTVASVDSVYSDDTSLSSDNLDPSYSAIGGLQRVVSEFAEIGSVSPLVAASGAQESQKSKDPAAAYTSRLSDATRGSHKGKAVSTASVCSAEDGDAAYAALCGLQKVVHGFNEQECVSPFSAVRSAPHGGLRDCMAKKSCGQEEEESSRLPDSSPALSTQFLCEGSWLPKADSSYSALSGLQKVVNGFSDLGCVSPFSAVSTSASESAVEICSRKKNEQPAPDAGLSALSGLKKVINGVSDSSCVSPATASSNPSSVGEPDPGMRRRWEQSEADTDFARSHGLSNTPHRSPPRSGAQCIDLTLEEEPTGAKARTANQEKQRNELPISQTVKPMGGGRLRPPNSSLLIDLTEEEETFIRNKATNMEAARKPPNVPPVSASPHKAPTDRKHRATGARTKRDIADRPLDPGPSGAHRGGIPSINEHISGLEKLLKGVPTFTPPNTPSGQRRSGSWWFKSTSPHET
ncbi:uncharacterized protein [Pyxicephalus adspersus]|uniref:uncharacterized protein isoform X3 n=1 Tax=Pyxicephalus adspersus TaxID=30357 RepID=UPI003B5A235A